MTAQQAIEKIHSLDKFGSRPGLERIRRFLDILGNPQDSLRFVHVAGTNGKGSTCALLSSVLVEAGYKTGLFISPYIVDFRERIQINGEMVSGEVLAEAVERTFPIIEKLRADDCVITEFEYVMALEFLIHKEAACDIVVLETGMGGLLDCTNVILPPICSVITTIGLDHTAVLGDTIEKIAAQKCGIIKSGSIAVTSAQCAEAMSVIEADCADKGVRLVKSSSVNTEIVEQTIRRTVMKYNGVELTLPLIGEHQIENAKTALAALDIIGESFPISADALGNGFKNAENPARFELMCDDPTVILDGAHNPNGIEALKNAVIRYNDKQSAVLVLGMLADKDSRGSIKLLSGMFDTVYTVTVNNPRTLSAEALAEECKGFFNKVVVCKNVREAVTEAFTQAKHSDSLMVIAGSLYLAGEIRPILQDIVKTN